ncbi:hypothetical protein B0H19DRAFT_1097661 [Mycena capillaripes]|nr:hypothetical protein B0H19DRAFT_1097661 [Mycena capillaripes]
MLIFFGGKRSIRRVFCRPKIRMKSASAARRAGVTRQAAEIFGMSLDTDGPAQSDDLKGEGGTS